GAAEKGNRPCRGDARPGTVSTSIAVGRRPAQPAIVLGDRILEAACDPDRRRGPHRRAARVAGRGPQLELRLLEQIDQRAILALDQIRVAVARQPAAQRFRELAYRAQLRFTDTLGAKPVRERQELRPGRLEPLPRLLEPLRILPESVRVRPPDVAAVRIVEATARAIAAAIERTAGVQAALLRAALLTALLRAALLLPTGLRVLLRLLILLRLPRLTLLGGLTLLPRLPRLTGRRERGLTRVERPRLPRQLVELAPQRLKLRDQ